MTCIFEPRFICAGFSTLKNKILPDFTISINFSTLKRLIFIVTVYLLNLGHVFQIITFQMKLLFLFG